MKLLDLTLPAPAANLACDEALLDRCESGAGEEVLRFWESNEYFVVVGYSNKVVSEVNVAACEVNIIPIYRRCSGGGTVVQGPGCLNYTLILKITKDGPLGNIGSTNRFVMERNRKAIETILPKSSTHNPEPEIAVCGHTDITIGGLKFSGNAQRRHRQFLLFHGSFLLNFNLSLINELLPMPSKQPNYRKNRVHGEFLANLKVSMDTIKTALQDAWKARTSLESVPHEQIASLVHNKYATRKWNWKF
jgi:lipoate-protein ligase A